MAVIDSLISYWSLEEASGTRDDAHGSNDLTDNNGVGNVGGIIGNAAQFTSANLEYLSRASNASLQTGDIDFSFALWIRFNDLGAATIFGKDVDTPASSRDYAMDFSAAVPRFYINGGANGIAAWGSTLSADVWYFIVAWHDAANDLMAITVNDGTPVTQGTTGVAPQASGAEFRIGARAYVGFEEYIDAFIDEFGFWKKKLSAAEITWLYNSGAGRSYANIVAEAGLRVGHIGEPVIAGSTF